MVALSIVDYIISSVYMGSKHVLKMMRFDSRDLIQ